MQHIPLIGPSVTALVGQTHFFLVLEYGGYFLLGYYLTNNTLESVERYSLLYIFAGVILTVAGTFFVSRDMGQTSELFLGYIFPTTFLTSVGIFIYFKGNVARWNISATLLKIVYFISTCSLGIYAVHMFFLAAFHKIGLTYSLFSPIISIPLICIVTLALSMTVAYVMKRWLPKGKKHNINR